MTSITGIYMLYDVNASGIYHLYEVTKINIPDYEYSNNPICGQVDSSIYNLYDQSGVKFITEEEFIDKIRNILNDIRNDVRLCENCIIDIIAEKQDIFFNN